MSEYGPPSRVGSIGYQDSDGIWYYAAPGDKLFSTVTMIATHWWNGVEWKKIFEDDDVHD